MIKTTTTTKPTIAPKSENTSDDETVCNLYASAGWDLTVLYFGASLALFLHTSILILKT